MNNKQIHQKKDLIIFILFFKYPILVSHRAKMRKEQNVSNCRHLQSDQTLASVETKPRPRRLRVVSALVIIRSKPRHPSGRGII